MTSAPAAPAPSPPARRPVAARPRLRRQGRPTPAGPVVQLDAELRERRPSFTTELERRLVARIAHLPRGPFDAESIIEDPARAIGLLVLDGLIAVGLNAGRAQVSWLIGADDLVRPWDMPEVSLTRGASWQALTNLRVALLDADFSRRAAGIPAVARLLVAKASQTSHWLLAKSLIISAPVVEERLLLLFALLAERWGKVRPDGVWLELPLTHDLLARMSGARRPSVSTALRSLGDAGLVESLHRGCWLLHAAPPPPPAADWMLSPCWRRYAEAIGFSDGGDGVSWPGRAA
jgi:CRP/FNR family cyclic AMP-dependent transcriptional regulator